MTRLGTGGRVLRFEGIENFRDAGGYEGQGGTLAAGRLFRSAHQGRATEADLQRLDDLNLAVVVDLRRPDERRRDPCRRPPSFGAHVIETALEGDAEAPYVKFLRETDLTAENGHGFMLEEYRRLPFEPAHVEVFGRCFRAIAETGGPVLIHCAAGKDRTGLLVALIQHLLGVSPDEIMADYLLTNEARSLSAWGPRFADIIEREYGRRPPMEAVEAFLRVHPDWLRAAFDEIDGRAGRLDTYLETVLGVDAAMKAQIARRLLV
jgi:protein tyrosine/serine phosphatase